MAYFEPYIDYAGFHMPSYIDIRDDMIEQAKTIFGPDVYLSEDSQDYQYISVISRKIYDTLKLAEEVYNNRGPTTAVGSALDSVVKLNGLSRKAAQHSKCKVKIVGEPNTTITNGVVSDVFKNKWDIPDAIIPDSGYVYVEAVAQTAGAIVSDIGNIKYIETPTQGWEEVYNEEPAEVGNNTETDSELRSRQAVSTAQPSRTVLIGIVGAVAAVKNIKRYKVYENDTNITDENTVPPHSICVVAEDGESIEIAEAIYKHKTPGCGTYGDTSETIVDDTFGTSTKINFCRPEYVDIAMTVRIKALNGYTNSIADNIKTALVEYASNFEIGNELNISALWGVIFSVLPNLYSPSFSILSVTAGVLNGDESTNDIEVNYNQVVRLSESNINVIQE